MKYCLIILFLSFLLSSCEDVAKQVVRTSSDGKEYITKFCNCASAYKQSIEINGDSRELNETYDECIISVIKEGTVWHSSNEMKAFMQISWEDCKENYDYIKPYQDKWNSK